MPTSKPWWPTMSSAVRGSKNKTKNVSAPKQASPKAVPRPAPMRRQPSMPPSGPRSRPGVTPTNPPKMADNEFMVPLDTTPTRGPGSKGWSPAKDLIAVAKYKAKQVADAKKGYAQDKIKKAKNKKK